MRKVKLAFFIILAFVAILAVVIVYVIAKTALGDILNPKLVEACSSLIDKVGFGGFMALTLLLYAFGKDIWFSTTIDSLLKANGQERDKLLKHIERLEENQAKENERLTNILAAGKNKPEKGR